MKNFDYYNMVIEMLDKLYEHEGFQEWYDSLDINVENQIEKDLVGIVKRRISKNKIEDNENN
jgi:lipopolysaccharide biosynthesis regulator YciM